MVWHFVSLFPLAALLVLKKFKPGWLPLIVAALLCGLGTSSQGTGWFVSFPVILVALWMFEYRKPGYFVFWIAATLIALRLYTLGLATRPGQVEVSFVTSILDVENSFIWITAFLGNPFATLFDRILPIIVGGLGLLFIALNLLVLWQYEDNWRRVNVWIGLAGIGLSAAVGTYVGTFHDYTIEGYTDQVGRVVTVASPSRYSIIAAHFWMALLALMALVYWHHQRSDPDRVKTWQRVLVVSNAAFVLLLGGLYVRENTWSLQFDAILYGRTVTDSRGSETENCFHQVALTHDPCWPDTGEFDYLFDQNYKLAYYSLGQFSDHQEIPLLPSTYVEGSPVIVDTPAIWMNAYLRRWYLPGVGEDNLFHIAPPSDSIERLAAPLTDIALDYSGDTPSRLAAFTEGSETVWYLRTDETAANEATFTALLADLNYVPTVVPSSNYRINEQLTLIRYDKSPQLLDESINFGDAIHLMAWQLRGEESDSPACQPLTVQTWWQASKALTHIYQIQVAVTFEDGTVISESAGGLTTVPTPFWEPNQLYLDERRFFVACELAPGRYELAVQVNDTESGQPLPARPEPILRDWLLPD